MGAPSNHADLIKAVMEARLVETPDTMTPVPQAELPPVLGQVTLMTEKSEGEQAAETEGTRPVELKVTVRHFSEVFVLWREYTTCAVCAEAIADKTLVLPATGVYTCPHNQAAQYKAIMDSCLAGKTFLQNREFFNSDSSARCVHLEWVEEDPASVARRKRAAAKNRKNNPLIPTFGVGDLAKQRPQH